MDLNLAGADVPEVSLRVVLQVVGHGHPDGTLAALDVVLEYYTRYRTALTHTRAVAYVIKK